MSAQVITLHPMRRQLAQPKGRWVRCCSHAVKRIALTFDRFATMCAQAESSRKPLPVHVQMRKAGEVLCGQVLDARPGQGGSSVDFYQVRSELGVSWCSHHNVRPCSGFDGRCGCEGGAGVGDAPRAAPTPAPAFKAPHGNTGVAA